MNILLNWQIARPSVVENMERPGPALDHATIDKAADESESAAVAFHVLFAVRQGRSPAAEHPLQGQRQLILGDGRQHLLRWLSQQLLRPVREQHRHLHRLALQLLTATCSAALHATQITRCSNCVCHQALSFHSDVLD